MSIQSEKLMTLAGGEALYNDLRNRVDDRAPIIIDSKSGNPVAISDGVPGLKLYDAKVSFAPRQEGTGDPSPTNIRPIIGWDGVQIVNGGENVLPLGDVYEEGWTDTVDGLTASYSNGVFSITGNHTISGWTNFTKETVWSSNPIILPPGTYTPANQLCIRCSIDGGEFANKSTTFTAKTNVVVRGFYIAVQGEGEKSLSVPLIMSPGSTRPTEYVPYRETAVYPVSWQTEVGTIYGGELDVVTGLLTITHAYAELTAGGKNSSGTYFYTTVGELHIPDIKATSEGLVCNRLKRSMNVSAQENIPSVAVYANGIIRWRDADEYMSMTASEYNTAVASDKVKIAYEIKEPYTVQLSTIQIALVEGTNNIWTDADTAEIAYPVDTKKYMDRVDDELSTYHIKDAVRNNSSVAYDGVITFGNGFYYNTNYHVLAIDTADSNQIKAGTNTSATVVTGKQHEASFYGLAKAAGDTTQSASSNAVGVYTPQAKAAIQNMIGVESGVLFIENVTGTTPTITGVPNVKYECGELTSLTLTAPVNGTIDVWFMTGNIPTMLTTSGVVFPSWFDPEYLEPNTTYEFVITDGYGGVTTWERPVSV